MKTKKILKPEKTFIEKMREIRDEISFEIKDMDVDQLKRYLKSRKTLSTSSTWKTKD